MLAFPHARLRSSAVRAAAVGAVVTLLSTTLAVLGAPSGAAPARPTTSAATSAAPATAPLARPVLPGPRAGSGRARSAVRVDWHDRDLRAGEAARVTGRTTPATAQRVVRLQRRGPSGAWRSVRGTRTDRRGQFELRVRHARSGRFAYRVRVRGTATTAPAATAPVSYTVERRGVELRSWLSQATVAQGAPADLVGTVAPARKGLAVHLQRQLADGTWATFPDALPVSRTGRWAVALDTGTAGTATYRATTRGTRRLAAATSAASVLTVEPVVVPPVDEPPVSEPPVSEPPTSEPPVSEPPVSEPPVSEPPTGDPTTDTPPTTPPTSPPPPTTPGTDPDPTPQPPPAPAPRFLLGAAHGGNTEPTALEADAGTRLMVRRTYYTHDKVARAVTTATDDLAKGRVPFVSFKLPYTWAEMAAGRGDAWAQDAARRLAAVGQAAGTDVWVVLHHEPEHDQPQILDWTALQQRLAPYFDLPGLRFGICVTGWNQFFSGNPEMSFEHIYPFGAPIDFIALDVYQFYGTPKNETKWTDLEAYWIRMEAFADRVGTAWGLGEYGITDEGFASPRGATFFEDVSAGLRAHGGSFAAYFDSELNTSGNSWWLSGAKRTAYLRHLSAVAAG